MNATLDGNPHENIHPLKSTSNQEIPGFPETIRELERISKPDIDRFLYALGFTLDDNDFEYKWMNLRRIIGIIKPGADDC